ncbi:MAG: glycosyltransferase family 4 protein [Bryobacteraceae bacterium]
MPIEQDRVRILYVSSCWLHDRAYGGQLRALYLARALRELGSVTVVTVGAHQVSDEYKALTAAEFDVAPEIQVRHSPVKGWRARARSLTDPEFTNIHGIVADERGEDWMKQSAKEFDLLWFSTLRTANSFRNARWRRSVIDIGDLPSSMHETTSQNQLERQHWLPRTARTALLRQHERHVMDRFSVAAVCSEADRRRFTAQERIHVIPNGFSRPASEPIRTPVTPPQIGFIGLLEYFANSDGLTWFVQHCLAKIQRAVPQLRVRLIGAGTDGPLKPDHPSVDGLGWVEDPKNEIAKWALMIVPIRMGGGTRVKIAEAFSRKCPLVSTSIGAYGYEVRNREELRLADDADTFAAACVELIEDRSGAAAMAQRAYTKFLAQWTWDAITPRVLETAEDCLRRTADNDS